VLLRLSKKQLKRPSEKILVDIGCTVCGNWFRVAIGPKSYIKLGGVEIQSQRSLSAASAGESLMTERRQVVILVEDDPSVLRAIRRLIVGAGFDVLAYDRPSALIKSVLPNTEACLLVDVHLPEMNGVDLCKTLIASGCELPILLITGANDDATNELVQTIETAAVLYKPFPREVLIAELAKAMSSGRKQ